MKTIQRSAWVLLFAVLLASGIRGGSVIRTIIFVPATLSVLVIGFLWRLILNPQWGAINQVLNAVGLEQFAKPWLGDPNTTLIVISLVSVWQWVGLPTMFYLAGLLTIPEELVEAARVDGSTTWSTYSKIIFPLLAPMTKPSKTPKPPPAVPPERLRTAVRPAWLLFSSISGLA